MSLKSIRRHYYNVVNAVIVPCIRICVHLVGSPDQKGFLDELVENVRRDATSSVFDLAFKKGINFTCILNH